MVELSKRLRAVANLVTSGGCVADIGTDHAYIPIYLMEQNLAERAIAMDINRGPLERAVEHVRESGLEDRIDLRLSDGLEKLAIGEADSIVAAGMGGGLIIHILTEGRKIAAELEECILQPQSEIARVRSFLLEEGYRIVKEDMVLDEGKYYPMMRVIPATAKDVIPEIWDETQLRYGKLLLEMRHPVLKQYLEREECLKTEIWNHLKGQDGAHICRREEELNHELECIRKGLRYYAV